MAREGADLAAGLDARIAKKGCATSAFHPFWTFSRESAFDPLRTFDPEGKLSGMQPSKRLTLCVLAAALGGCSYSYSLRAVVINGRLAFVVDPSSGRSPDCVRGITVSLDDSGPNAVAEQGDDEGLVKNGGAYWWENKETGSCLNDFPVFYGAPLEGKPFDYGDEHSGYVRPKKLRVGVIYEVNAQSSGSGYGSGWFRITPQLTVESWPEDPTPVSPSS
ncbi:hypothetical protein G7077_12590 [Sphingomonas piscis]|uniref:Uncharacterized protein n=1 Tax=Sphingomonas piscis TaxID=2714943 RepID=A0A6G7YLC3_9SPHN|nr:hypothetical protein [Sphingomonas piscis]QIK77538.1 hypothetical protein G7077_12590 [Sphingomonas piscis]